MNKDNKAYLLYDVEYDDYNFCAIFSTKKQLRDYIELHITDKPYLSYYYIAELPLNPIEYADRAEFNGFVKMEELRGDNA